jgi:uncharacterized protein
MVWLFDPRFDRTIPKEDVESALPHVQEFLDRYAYDHPFEPGMVVLDADEGRFMNHSEGFNVDLSTPDRGIATRDIPAGEELTCNYAHFTDGAIAFQPPRHRLGVTANAA